MLDENIPPTRGKPPGRVFWILGIMVGILAGGFVAVGLAHGNGSALQKHG